MKQCMGLGLVILILSLTTFVRAGGERMPLNVARRVNQVNLLISQDKISQALEFLEKAVADGKAHYYLEFLLGNVCLMAEKGTGGPPGKGKIPRDKTLKAARAFGRCVAKAPDMSPAWFNLARCRYELEELTPAARAFVNAYETAGEKAAQTLYYGAVCYGADGKNTQALAVFQRLIRDHRLEMKLAWKEAHVNVLFALEKYRESLSWIEELTRITQGARKKKWQQILLQQYMALEMKSRALEYARQLTRQAPTEPRWWKALAHIRLDRFQDGGEVDRGPGEALTALVVYGYLTPLNSREKRLLADLYAACNVPIKAAGVWADWIREQEKELVRARAEEAENTARLEKEILLAYHSLALSHVRGGDVEQALDWCHRGLALSSVGAQGKKAGQKLDKLKTTLEKMLENQQWNYGNRVQREI